MPASDPRFLYAVEQTAPAQAQRRIIEAVRSRGKDSAGYLGTQAPPFWRWAALTLPRRESCPEAAALSPEDFDRWAYFSRLNPRLDWEWLDHPAAPLVQELLAPLSPAIKKLTRVKVDLQIPGRGLKGHRDLVPGCVYSSLTGPRSYDWGAQTLVYEGPEDAPRPAPWANASHEENRYLSLKIPLSERAPEAGKPFVVLAGKKFHYDSGGRLFFLNEAEMFHGAEAVDFWRGVVFVNALWDFAALDRLAKLPLELRPA